MKVSDQSSKPEVMSHIAKTAMTKFRTVERQKYLIELQYKLNEIISDLNIPVQG